MKSTGIGVTSASILFEFFRRYKTRLAASPTQMTMPTTIPEMAPAPRRESLVGEDFETDREDWGAVDAVEEVVPVPRRELLVDEGFETDKVEDAVEALDVSRDAEIVVRGTADGEAVGFARTP